MHGGAADLTGYRSGGLVGTEPGANPRQWQQQRKLEGRRDVIEYLESGSIQAQRIRRRKAKEGGEDGDRTHPTHQAHGKEQDDLLRRELLQTCSYALDAIFHDPDSPCSDRIHRSAGRSPAPAARWTIPTAACNSRGPRPCQTCASVRATPSSPR